MYFNGYRGGRCPAGGSHARQTEEADYDFALPYNVPPSNNAQDNWRFCDACNSLYFNGYRGGRCPAGGSHRRQRDEDYNFVLPHDISVKPGSQDNWRFCVRCDSLYFNGYFGGKCPAGGPHTRQKGADYNFVLPFGVYGAGLSDDAKTAEFGKYVDAFVECVYDLNYRHEEDTKGFYYSPWLRLRYYDGV
jgi:hypothetical protein